MGIFSTLAACAALATTPIEADTDLTSDDCITAQENYLQMIRTVELADHDREAIARVAYAEAANQGDAGLAGVVYTILNRLMSGSFGTSISDVVNAPRQFEPVTRAGGNWEMLPEVSNAQHSKIDTIINLALDGRLPDLTNGALYFQNPSIVGQRELEGSVSEGLTHFGGATPSAAIQDHTFYASINSGHTRTLNTPQPAKREQPEREPEAWDVFGDLTGGTKDTWMMGGN